MRTDSRGEDDPVGRQTALLSDHPGHPTGLLSYGSDRSPEVQADPHLGKRRGYQLGHVGVQRAQQMRAATGEGDFQRPAAQ
jgi:hypothetical protein